MAIADIVKQENEAFRESNISAGKTKPDAKLEKLFANWKQESDLVFSNLNAQKQEQRQSPKA